LFTEKGKHCNEISSEKKKRNRCGEKSLQEKEEKEVKQFYSSDIHPLTKKGSVAVKSVQENSWSRHTSAKRL
jgi:hypothetical protein